MQICSKHDTNDSGAQCPRGSAPHIKSQGSDLGHVPVHYLLVELREIAQRPTLAEFRERLHTRKPVNGLIDTAALLREERAAR